METHRAARKDGEIDTDRDSDRIAPLTPETYAERLRGLTEAAESLLLLRAAMRHSPAMPGNPLP